MLNDAALAIVVLAVLLALVQHNFDSFKILVFEQIANTVLNQEWVPDKLAEAQEQCEDIAALQFSPSRDHVDGFDEALLDDLVDGKVQLVELGRVRVLSWSWQIQKFGSKESIVVGTAQHERSHEGNHALLALCVGDKVLLEQFEAPRLFDV